MFYISKKKCGGLCLNRKTHCITYRTISQSEHMPTDPTTQPVKPEWLWQIPSNSKPERTSQEHTFMQDWYSWECWTMTFIYYYSVLDNHVAPYFPRTTYLWHSLCSSYKTSKTGVKLHPYWPYWVKNSWLCHFIQRAQMTFSSNSAYTNRTQQCSTNTLKH